MKPLNKLDLIELKYLLERKKKEMDRLTQELDAIVAEIMRREG